MLMLLFYVGESAFALDTEYVVEVVPKVHLKKIPHAPESAVGILNFGGLPVPVIDFCYLLEDRYAGDALHTRIIILKYTQMGEEEYLGLLAEMVTETFEKEPGEFIESGFRIKDLPYLRGVLTEEKYTVQFVSVEALFKAMRGTLFKLPNATDITVL